MIFEVKMTEENYAGKSAIWIRAELGPLVQRNKMLAFNVLSRLSSAAEWPRLARLTMYGVCVEHFLYSISMGDSDGMGGGTFSDAVMTNYLCPDI